MVCIRKHKRRKNNSNRSDASLTRSFGEAFHGVDGEREEALSEEDSNSNQ